MTEVLDRSVGQEGPPPPPSKGIPIDLRSVGGRGALVGGGAMVLGLAVGGLTTGPAGRLLLVGGAGVFIAGLVLLAIGPWLYGPGPVGPAKRVARVAVPVAVLAVTAALVVATRPDDGSAPATVETGAGAGADHTHESPAPAAAGGEVTGTGGHVHDEGPPVPLDAATQKQLSAQLAATYEATARYPTVADATAAGLRKIGNFAPGSGAHYMKDVRPGFDPAAPTMWLYAGNEPTSPVVGVMFYSLNTAQPPEGYAGQNDHWHMHTGLCLKTIPEGIDLPLPVDKDATKAQCDAVAGRFMDVTGWMIHVWSAPGWESPQGVFSHDNPQLVCSDGTKAENAPLHVGCKGMS